MPLSSLARMSAAKEAAIASARATARLLLEEHAPQALATQLEHAALQACLQFCDSKNYTSSITNPRFQKLYTNMVRKAAHLARLRPDLVTGGASAQELLAVLSAPREQLYPEVWGDAAASHRRRMHHAYEPRQVAKTRQYACPRCKQRECDFYEMQCRSADESMTLFLTCLSCGHQWRIG